MSGWIKWEKDLETDPRVLRMVAALRRAQRERDTRNACVTPEGYAGVPWLTIVCGALVRFWSYADAHIRADDTLDLGPAEIDELVGIEGFAAAMPEDWLVVLEQGRVELPGYQEHNGVEAKKRAQNQKRQARHRQRKGVTPVTQERDARDTTALPDQDQTRPIDPPTGISNSNTSSTRASDAPRAAPIRETPKPIPADWKPNAESVEWMRKAGLKPSERDAVVAEFVVWARNAEITKANWDLAFTRNPHVKGAVGRARAAGVAKNSADEDKRRAQIIDLARTLRVERKPDEDDATFAKRVTELNDRRMAQARGAAAAPARARA